MTFMNEKTKLYAPQIDAIIERLGPANVSISSATYQKLIETYKVICNIKPGKEDEIRQIWVEVDLGPIEAFADYDELKEIGEVDSKEEFVQLWKSYYPDNTKWYQITTSEYHNEIFFYLNNKHLFTIKKNEKPKKVSAFLNESFNLFVNWIHYRIPVEISNLRQDPILYNKYIQQNLSWAKRLGKIRRKDYWNIIGDDTMRADKNLGKETIKKLTLYVQSLNRSPIPFQEMTANTFFKLCEICYDANDYFKDHNETLSPLGKYLKMSDGRDAGLRNIKADSTEAFNEWYHSSQRTGAHPWEICRGGNSTHISLYVTETDNKWIVVLDGSSIGRVEETVRMAVSLFENNIPFILRAAKEVLNMVTGKDFIGIVPDTVFPRYCHGLFPKKDKIIDFMNIGFDKTFTTKIIEKTYWFPLEEMYYL